MWHRLSTEHLSHRYVHVDEMDQDPACARMAHTLRRAAVQHIGAPPMPQEQLSKHVGEAMPTRSTSDLQHVEEGLRVLAHEGDSVAQRERAEAKLRHAASSLPTPLLRRFLASARVLSLEESENTSNSCSSNSCRATLRFTIKAHAPAAAMAAASRSPSLIHSRTISGCTDASSTASTPLSSAIRLHSRSGHRHMEEDAELSPGSEPFELHVHGRSVTPLPAAASLDTSYADLHVLIGDVRQTAAWTDEHSASGHVAAASTRALLWQLSEGGDGMSTPLASHESVMNLVPSQLYVATSNGQQLALKHQQDLRRWLQDHHTLPVKHVQTTHNAQSEIPLTDDFAVDQPLSTACARWLQQAAALSEPLQLETLAGAFAFAVCSALDRGYSAPASETSGGGAASGFTCSPSLLRRERRLVRALRQQSFDQNSTAPESLQLAQMGAEVEPVSMLSPSSAASTSVSAASILSVSGRSSALSPSSSSLHSFTSMHITMPAAC